MHIIISLFFGVCFKLYDDFHDNKLVEENSVQSKLLEVLVVFSCTLLLLLDFGLSVLFIFIIGICYVIGQIDTNFWKAVSIIPFLTMVVTAPSFKFYGVFDLIMKIIIIFTVVAVSYLEDCFFPEEASVRKRTMRIVGTFGFIFLNIIFTKYFENYIFYTSLYTVCIGYCIANIIFQFVNNDLDKKEIKIEKEHQDIKNNKIINYINNYFPLIKLKNFYDEMF